MFRTDADLFFLPPHTVPCFPSQFGVLYLLRRDINVCMGIDPNTGHSLTDRPLALWPGAMAIMAGIDLLAKFFAGSDDQSKVKVRFYKFLEHFFVGTAPEDRDVIYQLRNSLLHSFGLYSSIRQPKAKPAVTVYRFVLTNDGTTALATHVLPDRYYVDLKVLHREFEKAVGAYCSAMDSDLELQANFAAMYGNYGSITITESTLKQTQSTQSGLAQLKARSWAVPIIGAVVFASAIIIASTGCKNDKPVLPQPSASSTSGTDEHAISPSGSVVGSTLRSASPPPRYRIFKQSSVNPTSVVVAENTTDEQLRSLLWFLREKVRSHDFKAIGLTVPTSTNFGKKNWDQGLIAIYKGAKCADEEYATKGLGPCGYGEHSVASYQWGIDRQADQDSADLVGPDGNLTVVFDYKDGWTPPSDVQAAIQAERVQQKAGEEEKAEKNKTEEDLFATALQRRVTGLGFHMDVFRGSEADELVVNSELFKDDSGRVQFLSSVLPNWRKDLCRVGYRTIRLKNGTFSLGDNYSIGCR